MSNEIRDRLDRAFKIDKLENALFYSWKYGLRFELNTGGSYVEMFSSAYDRARELLEHTFENSAELYVLLRFYDYVADENKKPKEMRRLKRCDRLFRSRLLFLVAGLRSKTYVKQI